MLTGVSYMGHHNPKHIKTDILEMKELKLDDVLISAQENDFEHMDGKLKFGPSIALDHGIRPIAIIWGALNLFGGGRSSQFLLDNPAGFQVAIDGSHRPQGCYVNPECVARIQEMIDTIAECGFQGYFVDEPTPLSKCYCSSCRAMFEQWFGGDLAKSSDEKQRLFRRKCVLDYIQKTASYCKANHPQLETMTCLMPCDQDLWQEASKIKALDNLGTDHYWVNDVNDVQDMVPLLTNLDVVCKDSGKIHHEWLQCWDVRKGNEHRISEQGKVFIKEQPEALYVWAWQGQVGTKETCDDPVAAWKNACEILRLAKERQ